MIYYASQIKSSRHLFLLDLVIIVLYHILPFLDWSIAVWPLFSSEISIFSFLYLNLIIAMKSVQNIQLSLILDNFTLFHQSSSLSFVCCSGLCYTRAAGSDSEGSPRGACWGGHEGRWVPVSIRTMNWLPLAQCLQCSEVQQVLVYINVPRSRGSGGLWPCCIEWQAAWNFFFERRNCVQGGTAVSPLHQLLYVTDSFFSSWRAIILDSFCNFPVLPRVHHLATNLANRSSLWWQFWLWNSFHFRRDFWEISQYLLTQ